MNFRAKKGLGQNFLSDRNIAYKIVRDALVSENDVVLEVGPGLGFLTRVLLEKANSVVGVELDKFLYEKLRQNFSNTSSLLLIQGDCLDLDWGVLPERPNKLVANIPYYITSQIIFKSLDYYDSFESITLMMQKEVGDRIVAQHNTRAYGILSVIVQLFWDVKILMKVGRHLFKPVPKVDSSVITFIPKHPALPSDFKIKDFLEFVKFGFNQRRKILFKRLITEFEISEQILEDFYIKNNLELKSRPENIPVESWLDLYSLFKL